MSVPENENNPSTSKDDKPEDKKNKKDPCSIKGEALKISTETSTFFLLPKFDSKDISYQERLPKNFKELEQLLNKIFNNLEETEIVFINQVKEVVDRDLKLVRCKMKLENFQECLAMKQQIHERIDQSVQFILNLSNDLQNILSKMEKDLTYSPDIANGFKFTPDRMIMYDCFLKMNLKQKDMLQQVSDDITTMNESIGYQLMDAIGQIARTLNLHLETLGSLERKIISMEEELTHVRLLHDYYIKMQNEMLGGSKC